MPGIFGRLGDLGAIDEKYDVAVSTAAGALDHIVVDTVDTGSKCIQHLKANNLGIGSFIALEKQQALRQQVTPPSFYLVLPSFVDFLQVELFFFVEFFMSFPSLYGGKRVPLVFTEFFYRVFLPVDFSQVQLLFIDFLVSFS